MNSSCKLSMWKGVTLPTGFLDDAAVTFHLFDITLFFPSAMSPHTVMQHLPVLACIN